MDPEHNEVPELAQQHPEEPPNEPADEPADNEGNEPHAVEEPQLMIVGIIPGGAGDRRDPIVTFEADGSFEPIHQPIHEVPQRHRPGVVGLPANPTPGASIGHGAGPGQFPGLHGEQQALNPGDPIPIWPWVVLPEQQGNNPGIPMPIFIGPDWEEEHADDDQEDPAPEA